jgi:hypothetical protein
MGNQTNSLQPPSQASPASSKTKRLLKEIKQAWRDDSIRAFGLTAAAIATITIGPTHLYLAHRQDATAREMNITILSRSAKERLNETYEKQRQDKLLADAMELAWMAMGLHLLGRSKRR